MKVNFHKYHGTGNDFILVDNRIINMNPSVKQIKQLCHRRFGIGSDGLILIENTEKADYHMNFYNPDGSQSFCGNGSRCALHFCKDLGIITKEARFLATDGVHEGHIEGTMTEIHLADVSEIKNLGDCYFVNTGSPHAVVVVENVEDIDVVRDGRKLRHDQRFGPGGCNVNFIQFTENGLTSRVYERGVENETYSSGTGTTAQALCGYAHRSEIGEVVVVSTKGGELTVRFNPNGAQGFRNIWLRGSVVHAYSGQVEL